MSDLKINQTKILIIGDSISIGYTPYVEKYFKNKATISHNPGNAQHTGTGLEHIETWIGDADWDIIQINWGLWDLCYKNKMGEKDKTNGHVTHSIDAYKANLTALVNTLKNKTTAKLIFVTTTYVPEHEV